VSNPSKPSYAAVFWGAVAAHGGFCFVFVLHASLLAVGCGDPVFASFVVSQDDDSTKQRDAARAGARGQAKDSSGDNAANDNAAGDDSEPKAGQSDASVEPWAGLAPEGCFVLPDLSIISNVDSGVVVAREAQSQGCALPDGGGGTSAGTTYVRSDGLPLVEAGERYSFRWSSDTFMTRVRVLGGAKTCSVDPLLFSEPGTGITPGLTVSTCREFKALETAKNLRLYGYGHDFYSPAVLNANVVFVLCPGSCPPNTQFIPDGGV
jgi:hypothetical protein